MCKGGGGTTCVGKVPATSRRPAEVCKVQDLGCSEKLPNPLWSEIPKNPTLLGIVPRSFSTAPGILLGFPSSQGFCSWKEAYAPGPQAVELEGKRRMFQTGHLSGQILRLFA